MVILMYYYTVGAVARRCLSNSEIVTTIGLVMIGLGVLIALGATTRCFVPEPITLLDGSPHPMPTGLGGSPLYEECIVIVLVPCLYWAGASKLHLWHGLVRVLAMKFFLHLCQNKEKEIVTTALQL